MSGPYVEQTGEPAALDEGFRLRLALAMERVVEVVRAEVAAAEERGARAERERCAEELRRTHRSSHAVLGATDEQGRERRNRCITDGQDWPCVDEQTAEEWERAQAEQWEQQLDDEAATQTEERYS